MLEYLLIIVKLTAELCFFILNFHCFIVHQIRSTFLLVSLIHCNFQVTFDLLIRILNFTAKAIHVMAS